MNNVSLIGRLTKDPDVRYTQGNEPRAVAHYTLAVDRRRRSGDSDNPGADFISCTAFGKSAEFAEKYFHKGIKIGVRGRIQTGSYTNREGQTVYTTEVIVEDQEFVESKKDSQNTSPQPQQQVQGQYQQAPQQQYQQAQAPQQVPQPQYQQPQGQPQQAPQYQQQPIQQPQQNQQAPQYGSMPPF